MAPFHFCLLAQFPESVDSPIALAKRQCLDMGDDDVGYIVSDLLGGPLHSSSPANSWANLSRSAIP
jgi:hypothetical protein